MPCGFDRGGTPPTVVSRLLKSFSDLQELLMDIRKRPTAHFRKPCYEKLCAFIRGIECATYPFVEEFRGKVIAAGAPSCLPWEFGLLFVLFGDGGMDIVISDPEADSRPAVSSSTGWWSIWTPDRQPVDVEREFPSGSQQIPLCKSGNC